MSLKPGEDIGEETHDDLDQFTRIEQGRGLVQMGSERKSVPQASHACVSSRAARLRPADGAFRSDCASPVEKPPTAHFELWYAATPTGRCVENIEPLRSPAARRQFKACIHTPQPRGWMTTSAR